MMKSLLLSGSRIRNSASQLIEGSMNRRRARTAEYTCSSWLLYPYNTASLPVATRLEYEKLQQTRQQQRLLEAFKKNSLN